MCVLYYSVRMKMKVGLYYNLWGASLLAVNTKTI